MKFGFGTIVSMDYEPGLRIMVLCQNLDPTFARETWNALVLVDSPLFAVQPQWPVGAIVTVSPHTSGVVVIEEADWITR